MTTFIGVCELTLHIPESQSLKDKRSITKSLIKRVQNTHNVSISEVDQQDKWQLATIAIATVTNSAHQSDTVIRHIIKWIEENYPQVQIINETIETIPL